MSKSEETVRSWWSAFFEAGSKGKDGDWSKCQAIVTEDFRFVRPTGNPLGMSGFIDMMSMEGMSFDSSEIIEINKVHEGTDSGIVCVTSHDKFTYKGTPNDDICVITFYTVKDDQGSWKIAWGQRSTGRKPEDERPSGF